MNATLNKPAGEPAGSKPGFRGFYERHFDYVVRFFIRKGCDRDDSADLAQDTFVRAYRFYTEFRGESQAQTWLTRIAINVFNNHLRHHQAAKRKGEEISLTHQSFSGMRVEAPQLKSLINDENREHLNRAMHDLPPQMQRCVRLRLEQDRKYKDIARLLDISIQTVKSQLFEARKRLRDNLADWIPENRW